MYVSTHDAVARVISGAFSGKAGRDPWYLRPEGVLVGMTADAAEAAYEKLAARYPNRVKRPD